jgi:hypothetical protein
MRSFRLPRIATSSRRISDWIGSDCGSQAKSTAHTITHSDRRAMLLLSTDAFIHLPAHSLPVAITAADSSDIGSAVLRTTRRHRARMIYHGLLAIAECKQPVSTRIKKKVLLFLFITFAKSRALLLVRTTWRRFVKVRAGLSRSKLNAAWFPLVHFSDHPSRDAAAAIPWAGPGTRPRTRAPRRHCTLPWPATPQCECGKSSTKRAE